MLEPASCLSPFKATDKLKNQTHIENNAGFYLSHMLKIQPAALKAVNHMQTV